MNKSDYQAKSTKLRLPQRCPHVGYCQRWAWTMFFYNYRGAPNPTDDIGDVLRAAGDLPSDYEEKKIPLSVEPPVISEGDDFYWVENCCPEIPLFDGRHSPSLMPNQAVSSLSWQQGHGIESIVHKHFSECLEYIQNDVRRSKRRSLSQKVRFKIFERDGFACVYCGKSKDDGAVLHVDHKRSVRDSGSDDPGNLVTACDRCNLGKGADSVP